MFMQKVFSHCCKSAMSRRFITQSTKNFESKISDTSKVTSTASTSSSTESASSSVVGARMIEPSNFEKWILVWMKKYPKGEVPNRVKDEVMYQVKSRARVKAANYMTAFAVFMCIVGIISGRKARRDGESLHQQNVDWHKQVNEEHKASIANKN